MMSSGVGPPDLVFLGECKVGTGFDIGLICTSCVCGDVAKSWICLMI